ncbi:MAG: helix-turn-helix domain-containing protein [Lysobacter sp.]|nr:helix-turn-helix domain-containing protein [Lysobacter sp.]
MKPKETDFEPKTLGQHLRKRRLVLNLTQKQVARALGISPFTVLNLERDRTQPAMAAYPALVRWLGYNPFPVPKTLQEHMRAARRAQGWTIVEAAKRLVVDPSTWGEWEKTGRVAWKRTRASLDRFLEAALGE